MSIDAKIDELITAINSLADSNRTLAGAYLKMVGAPDNGPPKVDKPKAEKPAATKAAEVKPPPAAPAAATPAALTLTDVRQAVMALGDRDKVMGLIASFGAEKLSDIPESRWPDVMARVTQMSGDLLS